ncbi:hypothetical protein C9I57_05310 [Trinickia symbiotica]|uniref:Uncharacterized protein n=1 Tax=Trinickia symbiotica TaxID=863227 RepID=A0A2T3XZW3_9BURK|nr:hypothetical protein [Trinickia symbiotica]PTB22028.1 hypothetical protein C9I57_05310 [Trinickia symbiotica]
MTVKLKISGNSILLTGTIYLPKSALQESIWRKMEGDHSIFSFFPHTYFQFLRVPIFFIDPDQLFARALQA